MKAVLSGRGFGPWHHVSTTTIGTRPRPEKHRTQNVCLPGGADPVMARSRGVSVPSPVARAGKGQSGAF